MNIVVLTVKIARRVIHTYYIDFENRKGKR